MSSSLALAGGRRLLAKALPAFRCSAGSANAVRTASTDKGEGQSQYPPSSPDEAIHTGQQWSADDVRNVRFMHRTKEVNPRWAIDLIKEVPPKVVHTRVTSCDGGGGALGHPRVYINLDSHEPVSCIYCGLRYVFKGKDE